MGDEITPQVNTAPGTPHLGQTPQSGLAINNDRGEPRCSALRHPNARATPSDPRTESPFPVVRLCVRPPSYSTYPGEAPLPKRHRISLSANAQQFQFVWLFFITSFRWIPVEKAKTPPLNLLDFRPSSSFILTRLPEGCTWEDVNQQARVQVYDGVSALVVRGNLKSKRGTRRQEMVIIAVHGQPFDCNEMLNMVLVRIAPWKLLFSAIMSVKHVTAHNSDLTRSHEKLTNLPGVTDIDALVRDITGSPESARPRKSPGPSRAEEFCNTARLPSDALKVLMDYVGTGATVMKQTSSLLSSSSATNTAPVSDFASVLQHVSDATRGISIVSATFQVLYIGVQLVVHVREAKRGDDQYPLLLGFTVRLYQEVARSIGILLQPSAELRDLQRENLRIVLEQIMELIAKAEEACMRSKMMRVWRADELKKVEEQVEVLQQNALLISTQADVREVGQRVQNLETDVEKLKESEKDFPRQVSARPTVTKYFSGRAAELENIRCKLQIHGKALISQYGGAGKTQLMSLLANEAEEKRRAPGGVFWVTVDGEEPQVLSSIASFAEALSRQKMESKDRSDRSKVYEKLKNELKQRNGRWLLCLDNADNSDANGVIGDVCEFANPENGWVVVTSRQGFRSFSTAMDDEHTVEVKPLTEEMATVVLWRWKTGKGRNERSDDQTLRDLISNEIEYSAIQELLIKLGRNGLPLVLHNVGSYVRSSGISFKAYLKLYESRERSNDLRDILRANVERGFVHKEQRAVWTTWRLSIECLTAGAKQVVGVLSLFGSGGIPESLIEQVVKCIARGERCWEVKYTNWVKNEIVNRTSLLQIEGKKHEMHPLIQQFIASDVCEVGETMRNAVEVATIALYGVVETATSNYNASVAVPPEAYGQDLREILEHALSFIRHSTTTIFGAENERNWKLADLHFFVICALVYQFRLSEALEVGWKFIERCNKRLGSDMIYLKSRALNDIGKILLLQDKKYEAVGVLENSLQLESQRHGDGVDHINLLNRLNNLGEVYRGLDMLDKAESMYRKSLEMARRLFDPLTDHEQIAISMHGLCSILSSRNLLKEAEEMATECLQMQLRRHGETNDRPDVAKAMHQLGRVMSDQKKFSEAVKLLRGSLAMYRRIFGESADHTYIAIPLRNLGLALEGQGDLEAAEVVLLESIAMFERLFGERSDHRFLKWTREDLENVINQQQK